jgi:Integrase core domain
MIRDRDRIYGTVVTRRLRATGIRDKPIAAASPWQNGFAERLIGSIRRECLDHIIVSGEAHLRRILISYAAYYTSVRTHRSLNKDAPIFVRFNRSESFVLTPYPRRGSPSLHPDLSFRYTQRWSANERPKLMKKLIKNHRPDSLPETADILACLQRSISLFRERNLLAHGMWWEFNEDAGSIIVRSWVEWPDEDQHRTFTVAEIEDTANSLDELEVELWHLQRAIEVRSPPPWTASSQHE